MSKNGTKPKFVVDFPELTKQWHPTKNGDFKPENASIWSRKKTWWKCDKGPDHEWETTIHARTYRRTGCPFCKGLRVSVTNSLVSLHPDLAKEWHKIKNEELKLNMIVAGSHKSVWWKCDKGPDHVWKTRVAHRTGNAKSGCPFCRGLKPSETNSLASCYPELSKEWYQEKNGDITPDKVVAGSGKPYWWKCDKGPDHLWKAAPNTRTNQKRGCPFCAGQKVSVTNSLASCYPELAEEW
ncbi:MAG: zinc-ribbon domain-containing protein, partial [Candidatus Heimdallarchaeota archaeon]|nr:zinc-ribbon domain-containing protein [Candidatus Heimdallarchaeota archaeon]